MADTVCSKLQNAIVEGIIPAGSKISEPALAIEFGISRGPLREALSRLEACNLIERTPNVGARVVSLTPQHLVEIYLIRESLEGLAARMAAENMSDKEINELDELLEKHQQQIKQDQSYYQKEGDMDFHFQIVKGSKNSHLIDMFSNDLYHLIRLYRYQFGMVSNRVQRAFIEHGHIVDAIRQRDGELAQFLMSRHISSSRKNVEKMLDEHLTITD
ncbi:MAG: GntR family transcriptional regulator [Gammaproteobacteria bacterium]|nr:MAG: GntR family transcriptional regulator [Gammaproteobacteria bacterium]RLA48212.1 MAG: GntR family transcriptional regulator [Gammaproteobacteria bacterium]